MSAIKKLANETIIYGLSAVTPKVLTLFLTTLYMTNKFGNSDYGTYSELYAYSGIFLAIMVFRLDTAFFRFGSELSKREVNFASSFYILLFISSTISGILYLWADQIAIWSSYVGFEYYIRWIALILWFDAVTTLVFARFRLESRPVRFMFYKIANVVLTITFILFFLEILPRINQSWYTQISSLLGIKKEIDYIFFSNLMASLVVFLLLLPELFRYRMVGERSLIKPILLYSAPLVIVSVAAVVNQSGAAIFLKYFLDFDLDANKAVSGSYMAVAKIALGMNLFTTAFSYAVEPYFFRQHAEDPDKKEVYGVIALAYSVAGSVIVLSTYLFADIIVKVFGQSYRDAIDIVPYLLYGFYFLGLYYNVAIWYKLSNKTGYGALISLISMIVTIGLSILLIPKYGYIASAVTSMICYLIMVLLAYFIGQKKYPIHYPVSKILLILGVLTLSVLVGYSIDHWPINVYAAQLLKILILTIYCIWLLRFKKDLVEV